MLPNSAFKLVLNEMNLTAPLMSLFPHLPSSGKREKGRKGEKNMTVSQPQEQQMVPKALLSSASPPALAGLLAPGWAFPDNPRRAGRTVAACLVLLSTESGRNDKKRWAPPEPRAVLLPKEVLCRSLMTSLHSFPLPVSEFGLIVDSYF